MKALKAFLHGLDYLEEFLIVVLLAFMSIMNFANVVSRYFLSASISFTEEITIMAFVWVTMLAIATAYKRSAHLGMSFIVELFPKKGQAVFALFSMVCSLVMIVILLVYGIQMVQGQIALNARTPAMQMPSALQGLSIPVGCVFILVRTMEEGFSQFTRLWKEGASK